MGKGKKTKKSHVSPKALIDQARSGDYILVKSNFCEALSAVSSWHVTKTQKKFIAQI